MRNNEIELPVDLQTIKIKHGPFKALGVWFSTNEDEIENLKLNG